MVKEMVMIKTSLYAVTLVVLVGLLALGCSEDDPVATGPGESDDTPGVLPTVPVPSSPTEILPQKSDEIDVGLSNEIEDFEPVVEDLRQMLDDSSLVWTTENRRLKLVCDGLLAENTGDLSALDRAYVSKAPRLLHKRYWHRMKQVVLDPGTSYSKEETVTYGSSTTNTESQSFSQTIGVEVSVGGAWKAFSASVTASYEQTSTREEINSVTFSEESSFTEIYSVESDPQKTIVYGLWQLVDVFVLVDEVKTPIHQSNTLVHVTIPEVSRIEFFNKDVIYQSVTKFEQTQ